MQKNKGFTLIELLVVIAIIGILSSVVLASLNTARAKGADAAVKSGMANSRAQAELFYDGTVGAGTYTAVCTGTGGINAILLGAIASSADTTPTTIANDAITTATEGTCNDTATASPSAWAAEIPLKGGGYYCVDSTGASQSNTTVQLSGTGITSC